VSDVNHRVVIPTVDGAVRTLRMPPIRARDVFPPGTMVAQVDGAGRLSKYRRTGHQESGIGVRVDSWIGRTLARRDVAGRGNEFPKLGVGHGISVDPESLHGFPAYRAFLAVERI